MSFDFCANSEAILSHTYVCKEDLYVTFLIRESDHFKVAGL